MTEQKATTVSVSFPKTARDTAVLLVEQMRTAINEGHIVVSDPQFQEGLESWSRNATRVLAKAE